VVSQNEKRGLEGVFRIVQIVKHLHANPEHHRPVPRQELLECRLRSIVAAEEEPVQELTVSHRSVRAEGKQPSHCTIQLRWPARHFQSTSSISDSLSVVSGSEDFLTADFSNLRFEAEYSCED
jgi:hypothetical protein